ncbi:hypothetical protein [Microbacterium sp. A84]|uniref:hypothetical protein n=1 Tax=Microbacterium sp. A84 TaxID=3450715 RepID=UPI003F43CDA7
MSTTVAAQHKSEQLKAYATAALLARSGNEWASVCFFYAAYRAVRCAFNNDARLNSDAAARTVDSKLSASSRHVAFHNGHPNRGPGVNDVVRYLYPAIAAKYELLHAKSVEVRYGTGLIGVTVEETRELADAVISELDGLELL